MSVIIAVKPGTPPPPGSDSHAAARRWVEQLADGACTEREFLTQILLLEDEDSEVTWEVLASLDQLHRRRRLDGAVFTRVKRQLQMECLGYGQGAPAQSVKPVPQSVMERAAAPAPQPASVPAPQPAPAGRLRVRQQWFVRWHRSFLQAALQWQRLLRPLPRLRSRTQFIAVSGLLIMFALGGYLLLDAPEALSGMPVVEPTAAGNSGRASSVSALAAAQGPRLASTVIAAPAVASETVVAPQPDMLDLPRALVRVDGDQDVATVRVRRRGSLHGPVTFFWWTEAGSAQSGRDFTQILRRWEVIENGAAGIELRVPLVRDAARTEPRAFYVQIGSPGRGASVAGRRLAQVEILPVP